MDLQQALEVIKELKKRCEELEKRLRIYENPHTPSSKKYIKVKVVRIPKKRGAPAGHKGTTRKKPIPDIIVSLEPKSCPKCNSKKIEKVKERKKIVEDIIIIKTVKEFHFYDCKCEKCNTKWTTTHSDLPKKGNFGPNITTLWEMMHYQGTIPFERLTEISKNCLKTNITQGGIHNVVYRTAKIFEPHFNGTKNKVSKSDYAGSDETKYSYNGKTFWLWVISTMTCVLVLIRNSRGSNVLEEVFGKIFDGILNSDCFSAYRKFKAREYQKCWAHILRSAKDVSEHNKEGGELYRMLKRMHEYIKKIKKNGQENTPKVKLWIYRQRKKIKVWLKKNYKSKAVKNIVLRMAKYDTEWFTCLKYSFVESTNNEREREIRKSVISRKISGCHRSEQGMRCREIMMSTILTQQKTKNNPFEFVRNGIEKYNSDVIMS